MSIFMWKLMNGLCSSSEKSYSLGLFNSWETYQDTFVAANSSHIPQFIKKIDFKKSAKKTPMSYFSTGSEPGLLKSLVSSLARNLK